MLNFPILRTNKELSQWRKEQKSPISFIPTMGSLHKGHGELIKKAKTCFKKENNPILISIFVNPLQFGPNEDFLKYPRDINSDIELAENFGASAIWAPNLEDIFPKGEDSHFKLRVPKYLTKKLCGKSRKDHFDGVATIIIHLLKYVKPKFIILGEKDWQQLIIIKNLIKDLDLSVQVITIPTIREMDGLAYSSRNKYLNSTDRKKALSLHNALKETALSYRNGMIIDLNQVKLSIENAGLKVEYLEMVNPQNLQPQKNYKNLILLAGAVRCGNTRLIDHTFLMKRKPIVAIDGPAGAGKSTVTRLFANEMGLLYLDTGAMYRAVAWLIQKEKVDFDDNKKISHLLKSMKLEMMPAREMVSKVFINDSDVTDVIRSPEITSIVSIIASNSSVRKALTNEQKSLGEKGGIVAEGRDIGTCVFPNAEVKIFLTASAKERAIRRSSDLKRQGFSVPNIEDLEQEIIDRDYMDSNRKISPLLKAEDAIELITDGLDIENVIKEIYKIFRSKIPEEVWPS